MNRLSKFTLAAAAVLTVVAGTRPALAQSTFSGNGNNGFGDGSAVGNGSLTVSNDGKGGVDFAFTLSGVTWAALNNDLVIYLDNGLGGGISSTSGLYPYTAGDGGQEAISENEDPGGSVSTLNFNSLLAPQYGIDFEAGFGDLFSINGHSNGGLSFIDGAGSGDTSTGGLSYSVSGDIASIDIPATEFGLSVPNLSDPQTIDFLALEVSRSGYSSNEATVGLSGNQGYGNTQTVQSVNTFAVVPEPSADMLLLTTFLGGSFYLVRRRRS